MSQPAQTHPSTADDHSDPSCHQAANRAQNTTELASIHPGNRFRLMAGLPMLPDHDSTEPDPADE